MFRYRSHAVWLLAATLAVLTTAPPPAAAGKSGRPERLSYTAGARTQTGIDVLEQENFAMLRGKRVGLITNQTGVDSRGRRTIDLLAHAPGVKLVALFSPEHGISGNFDAAVGNSTDPATHVPIYSLFGETRRPAPEMLQNLDALVFDVQDAGVRFYTYVTTMAYCMEAAAHSHILFIVLDRPNPLGGEVLEGPMLDRDRTSFVGYFSMPVRYAMTLGELARMFNAENRIGADLGVVAMKNWRRGETYGETRLAWISPSPNLRTLNAASLYPGIEVLQAAGVSVGRGTGTPFELFGAPWIHAAELSSALDARKIAGVRFAPARFTPREEPYKDQNCEGVTIKISDGDLLRPMRMALEIAAVLHDLYPQQFHLERINVLLGSQSTVERLVRRDAPELIVRGWSSELVQFGQMRAKYLLYQ